MHPYGISATILIPQSEAAPAPTPQLRHEGEEEEGRLGGQSIRETSAHKKGQTQAETPSKSNLANNF